jgi:RES domain-containing protein
VTPLPAPIGGADHLVIGWRLTETRHAGTWDDGEGAFRFGGRWNSHGVRAVYCSLDPATTILEVAVHVGFETLDMVRYTLTAFEIATSAHIHIVEPASVPNNGWLGLGVSSVEQQRFGDELLRQHQFIVIPSAVSPYSWNLLFDKATAGAGYKLRMQERFTLDPRLNPPPRGRR